MELIQKTIKKTIQILKEKELIKRDKTIDDLSKVVFNKFLNGSEKIKYTIKSKKQDNNRYNLN